MDTIGYLDARADRPDFRTAVLDDIEIKDGGNVFLFDGYSSIFGEVADLPYFTEEVEKGAFRTVLAKNENVPFLNEHRRHEMLATTRSGRLKLEEDGRGLRARAKLVKNDLSSRVKSLVDSGDITGMSTGFIVGKNNQRVDTRGPKPHRAITGFKSLLDVSTTWEPAYSTTEAQFRSLAIQFGNEDPLLLGDDYPQLGERNGSGSDTSTEQRSEEYDDQDQPSRVDGAFRLAAAQRLLKMLDNPAGGTDA